MVDELPASASHREFVQATAAMNRRLEEFDLDEAEKWKIIVTMVKR